MNFSNFVIPAKAGTQQARSLPLWAPAFAGVTREVLAYV